MPTGILDLMGYMQGQADAGRQQGKQSRLAQLASQAYAAPQTQRSQLVQQAIGVDPQSGFALDKSLQGGDDERMQRVGQMAGMLVNLPPEARAQAYPGIVQQLHSIGLGDGLPDQWDDSLLQYARQLAALGGGGAQDDTPADIRSLQMLQKNPELLQLDRERRQAGGMVPKLIKTSTGYAWGVPGGNLSPAYEAAGSAAPDVESVLSTANFMRSKGVPDGEIESWIASQPGFDAPQAQRAQPYEAPKDITPYQQAQLGIQQERLRAAQAASAKAAEAADTARSLKEQAAAAKQQKVQAAQADTIATYDDSIRKIDELLRSPDVGTLGTYTGDAMAIFPHSGARNARAALDTIKNRVLLDTISKLKALSATGASGFGALSNQEGEILKNSIASLDKAQTHDAIVAALKDIQRVMRTSRDRVAGAGQQAVPSAHAAGGWKVEVVQ